MGLEPKTSYSIGRGEGILRAFSGDIPSFSGVYFSLDIQESPFHLRRYGAGCLPGNSAGDLFGMLSSRDPNSRVVSDLQRSGIKRSRIELPGYTYDTVDGRNPKQPPGMYKIL